MSGETRAIIWCAVSTRAQNEPERVSLPEQEDHARQYALTRGWQVVDVMKVPGHSRRYIDFHELSSDAAEKGITAFQRLKAHWEARDFNVLILRDGDRFARTQALHAYITEQIITCGATIFSLADGLIDDRNYRMWIAMAGFKAAGEIDRLVRARRSAMTDLARRGLPITSRIPMSHRVIRDQKTGKAVQMVVDESKRRLWDDLAELILEGIGWDRIETELYKRFGHADEKGKPYRAAHMYRLIMKPLFWGHMARFHCSKDAANGYRRGRWIYDASEPIPEGAIIFRDTHEAVWTGKLADRIRQEIDRRSEHMWGKAKPWRTNILSGLMICGECGLTLAMHVDGEYKGVYCPAGKRKQANLPECSWRSVVSQRKIVKLIDGYLRQMVRENTTDIFDEQTPEMPGLEKRLARLKEDIAALEDQVRVVVRQQMKAPETVQHILDEEIVKIGEQLKAMHATRDRLQVEALSVQQASAVQQASLEEMANLTVDRFWQQEDRYINQMLHRLMGQRRLVMVGGAVVGVVEVQRKRRRPH